MSDEQKIIEEKPVEKKSDKILELNFKNELPWLTDRIIYLTKSGSHAYGTSIPESDEDYRGVVIPTLPYFFGCGEFNFEQAIHHEPDLVFYDVRKFIKLASKANPSILELLFVNPEDVLICNPLMGKILEHREAFLSQRIAKTFVGYAVGQLRALEKSIDTPPERANPKRAESIAAFGFDTKDAMHVVRLLRMGLEIIEGKGVLVRRPDAEELLSIRHGAWTAQQVFAFAKESDAKITEALKKTKLPVNPDMVKIDSLCTAIVQASFDHEINVPIMATGFKGMSMSFGVGNLSPKKLMPSEVE